MGHMGMMIDDIAEQLNSGSVASMDCLPDDLLVQILSLLPTKQAVSTSLLSKRWRTLFSFSQNLDFRYSAGEREDIQSIFNDFVDRSLASQGGKHLKKLFLRYNLYEYESEHCVNPWICKALEQGVSELHICIHSSYRYRYQYDFPSKVFTSATLVKLFLETEVYIPSFPPDTSLPALKFLHVYFIRFKGNQFSDVFLAACPALEDLTIYHQWYLKPRPVIISSKTIKKLSVTNFSDGRTSKSDIITLDVPSVVDLYYTDYAQRLSSLRCNLDSLVKATLELHFSNHHNADLTSFITGIRNVKILHFTVPTVKMILVCCKSGLPVFNNLVELVFSSKKTEAWKLVLPLLLERSPNLTTLVLSGLDCFSFTGDRFKGTPIPLNNQIKILRVMQCKGTENELKHISHFLLKMECLAVVKVYCERTSDDPKKMQLTEDLLKLPTASSKLTIHVL